MEEWGELLEPILPRYVKINISKDDNNLNIRYINIDFKGDFNDNLSNFNI